MQSGFYFNNQSLALYYERKAVKRTANHIGIGLLTYFFIGYVLEIALVLLRGEKMISLFQNAAFLLALNLVLSLLAIAGASLVMIKTEQQPVEKIISFSKPEKGKRLSSVMAGLGFCFVANIVVSFLQNIFPLAGGDIDLPTGFFGFLLSVCSVAIAPALLEEFLFRGIIMGSLVKFGKPFAIFTSALLFGLLHGNLVQIPFAFLVGLALGFLVMETGSLWTGVLIHFLNNLFSVLIQYLEMAVGQVVANAVYMLFLLIILLVGFFGIYLLCQKNPKAMTFSKTPHQSTTKMRLGWLCGSAAMIIFFVIVGLNVLLAQIQGALS